MMRLRVINCDKSTALKSKTWDPKTNDRIKQLDPRIQQAAINFVNDVETELGVRLRVTDGYRTDKEQNRLYAQGRTSPGKKVTHAKAGESYHNYRLAFDVVRMKGSQPDWTKISPDIAAIGKRYGFAWGGDWKGKKNDAPHFEKPGKSIRELKKAHDNSSTQEKPDVDKSRESPWKLLDRRMNLEELFSEKSLDKTGCDSKERIDVPRHDKEPREIEVINNSLP